MTGFIRWLPLGLAIFLWGLSIALWPRQAAEETMLLAWLNISLLIVVSLALFNYGIRLLRQKEERRPGSRLRAKLVIALVGMLLIPTLVIQIAANQMVEKGMNVWFDVRVDTLLDRALNLAQGFYARIEVDLKQGLVTVSNDDVLLSQIAALPLSYNTLSSRMFTILNREGWQNIQIFDLNERLIAGAQTQGLSSLEPITLGESARLALTLGHISTEFVTRDNEEVAVGYAPIRLHRATIGLLRAEVPLPEGIVQNARAVEQDYRTYRELERNRQAIRDTFTHAMLFIALLVALTAGLAALIFSRRLTTPIGRLAAALKQVTGGDLNVSIPAAPDDELGSLVHSFNRMAMRLKKNMEALEQTQHDLTDALSSSRQRQYVLETLLANLQTGVLLIDADGKVRLLNQALRELLKLPPDWIPGRAIRQLCSGRLRHICDFYSELEHQKTSHLQHELEITVGRRNLHILARGARLSGSGSAGFSGYLMVLDDVSELAEAHRHRAWAEVAQRLAHEIKNPLTPIKLSAERLQRRFRNQVDDTAIFDSCTHAVITQVERLQRLLADFSTLARMPRPRMTETAIDALLREIRDLYNTYPRVHVDTRETGAICTCDADQIRQILINLIDNALAATESAKGDVHLYAASAAGMIELHIEDHGEGIPEASVPQLFDPYFSTKRDGSGLGLAIAKRIADEHEGELRLVSAANPTHFCLRLPQQHSSMEKS